MTQTLIFDIEKFAVHDGPGIRTVIFMKGCPLHCLWCHNPESQAFTPEILFHPEKCTACRRCGAACPQHCHAFAGNEHAFDRTNCLVCGKCAEACFAEALERIGKPMTVEEVVRSVLTDKVFYDNSGGGVTLSGGEPMAHFEFTRELLKECRASGIHTAMETCGFAPEAHYRELLSLTNLWLWDVKAPPELHEKLTGVPADGILSNLKMIDAAGGNIVLRCPMIPGVNDGNAALEHIAAVANALDHVQGIDLEPYHPLGESKGVHLGRSNVFHSDFMAKERVLEITEFLRHRTSVEVRHP